MAWVDYKWDVTVTVVSCAKVRGIGIAVVDDFANFAIYANFAWCAIVRSDHAHDLGPGYGVLSSTCMTSTLRIPWTLHSSNFQAFKRLWLEVRLVSVVSLTKFAAPFFVHLDLAYLDWTTDL